VKAITEMAWKSSKWVCWGTVFIIVALAINLTAQQIKPNWTSQRAAKNAAIIVKKPEPRTGRNSFDRSFPGNEVSLKNSHRSKRIEAIVRIASDEDRNNYTEKHFKLNPGESIYVTGDRRGVSNWWIVTVEHARFLP
jgi:hypothetical protein